MKRALLSMGVMMVLAAMVGGVTVAYAQGNGNGENDVNRPCDQWQIGTVMGKAWNAQAGTITLLPRGESTNISITVNGDTEYRAWMANWEEVSFDKIKYGDWIAVCLDEGVANVVILLEAPYRLHLEGNVTAVSGSVVTVQTGEGGNFTINLTNAGVSTSGIEVGQPVSLTIGKQVPLYGRFASGLRLGWSIGRGNQGVVPRMKNYEQRLEKFQEKFQQRIEQRFEKWQGQSGN